MSVKAVLLCEDQQMAAFMRRFLCQRLGWHNRSLRVLVSPPGAQSGEQWVRQHYPNELKALRARHPRTLLCVATDADTLSVAQRIRTLEQQCLEQSVAARTAKEAVVLLVPKRNIESWLAYLRGSPIDESQHYPRHRRESDCHTEVLALLSMCQQGSLRQPAPPSLIAACAEWQRAQELPPIA